MELTEKQLEINLKTENASTLSVFFCVVFRLLCTTLYAKSRMLQLE